LPRRIWAEYEKKDKSAKRHRPQLYDSTNLVYRIQTKYEANLARGRRNYTVRYRDQSCSCGMWQMYRRPCSHAFTVCRFRRENPLHMYNVVYHSETFRAQYAHGFLPIRDADEWSQASWTLRADETRFNQKRKSKRGKRIFNEMDYPAGRRRCTNCKVPGHNKSTCKLPRPVNQPESSNSRSRKGGKKSKSKAAAPRSG